MIRVVAADDHQMFLQGLERLLQSDDRLNVVGTASDGDALLALIEREKPDVAVVDISMPGPGPVGIVEAIEAADWPTRTLALTMHFEPAFARELVAAGMTGYVVKEAAFDELTDAIFCVAQGEQYLSRALVAAASDETPLTERERACLAAAARGLTAKMIARELDITERTVRFHTANACRKLGVQRVTEAVAAAIRLQVISA